jgi:hypothetical protein
MKYRIRENCSVNGRYLNRDGHWTTWKQAAKFSSAEVADKFAKQYGIEIYGLFTQRACCDKV